MSELQIGLLVLGGFIVIVVVLYNLVQERRYRKQTEEALKTPDRDPILGADAPASRQREPAFTPARTASPTASAVEAPEPVLEPVLDPVSIEPTDPVIEPELNATPEPAIEATPHMGGAAPVAESPAHESRQVPRTPAPALPPAPPAPVDEMIDYVVRIETRGVHAASFTDAYTRLRTLEKPVRWLGYKAGAADWEAVQPWRDAHYQDVVVAVQLADRNGAATEEQLDRLNQTLGAVARTHGLKLSAEDMAEALRRAESIDRFCVDVDLLIGINVVGAAEADIDLAVILREAEAAGFRLASDGTYRLQGSQNEPLIVLCNHDAEPFHAEPGENAPSPGVTLQLDVPRVPQGLQVYDSMIAIGQRLAQAVGGQLVDDNLRPLTDTGIARIRAQLEQVYARMEARGVPAGSPRALRLFS